MSRRQNKYQEFAKRADKTEEWLKKLQSQLNFIGNRMKLADTRNGNSNQENESNVLGQEQIEDLLLEYIDDHKSADSREFGSKYGISSNVCTFYFVFFILFFIFYFLFLLLPK